MSRGFFCGQDFCCYLACYILLKETISNCMESHSVLLVLHENASLPTGLLAVPSVAKMY